MCASNLTLSDLFIKSVSFICSLYIAMNVAPPLRSGAGHFFAPDFGINEPTKGAFSGSVFGSVSAVGW